MHRDACRMLAQKRSNACIISQSWNPVCVDVKTSYVVLARNMSSSLSILPVRSAWFGSPPRHILNSMYSTFG